MHGHTCTFTNASSLLINKTIVKIYAWRRICTVTFKLGCVFKYYLISFCLFVFLFRNKTITTTSFYYRHTVSQRSKAVRYKQKRWCWKSICILFTETRGFVFFCLPKSHFFFQIKHSLQSSSHGTNQEFLSHSAKPLYADWSRWTWRPDSCPPTDPLAELDSHDCRWKGGAPIFVQPLDLTTLTPTPPPCWATYPLSSITSRCRLNSGLFFPAVIITESWSILEHYQRTLPETQCQHANLGWGGKGGGGCTLPLRWKIAVASRLHRGALHWTFWAELEPWGSWFWACRIQHKRRSESCSSEIKNPLPSTPYRSLSLSSSSQPVHSFVLRERWLVIEVSGEIT